jgi:rRNA-processing protein FCF1
MVPAGVSADDEITRVARALDYAVVSNDRGLTRAIDPELDLPVITYSIDQGYFYCHEV